MYRDAGPLAAKLTRCRFIGILKAAPAAYIINKHDAEFSAAVFDVGQERLQCLTTIQAQPTFSLIRITTNDVIAALLVLASDHGRLFVGRILPVKLEKTCVGKRCVS